MAIKHSVGKLNFELPFEVFISQQLALNNFDLLNITVNHLVIVANLSLHHRDPFDRLLIASALIDKSRKSKLKSDRHDTNFQV